MARVVLTLTFVAVSLACASGDVAHDPKRRADDATSYDVQRLALDSLFNGREHARLLVLWATDAANGPALEALASVISRSTVPRPVDVERLAPSLPSRVITEAAVVELFRKNPDGWAAFFRENAGAAGLVELSAVWLSLDALSATTYVGRSCGEHCRNVWRIVARRDEGRWHIEDVQPIRVPGV